MTSVRQRHLASYLVLINCLNTIIMAMDLSRQFPDTGFHSLDHQMIGNDFSIKNNMSSRDEPHIMRAVCEDTYGMCSLWAKKGFCDNCTFVMDNCPASCEQCTIVTVCADVDADCGVFLLFDKAKVFCTDPLVSANCDKTCGIGACAGTTATSATTSNANTTAEFLLQFKKVKDEASYILNRMIVFLSQVNKRKIQRQIQANDNENCEDERSFELLLEYLQNFCDLKYNIFSTVESNLEDFSNNFIKILSLNSGKQIPLIETIVRCASEIKTNAEEEIFLLEKLEAIQPEIDTVSGIFNKLSELQTVLTNLKDLQLDEDVEKDPDIVFAEIIKLSNDLYRERELGITDFLESLLDKYYLEVNNSIASSQNGEIVSVNGVSQSISSVIRAKSSLIFAKTELTERQLSGSEFSKKRQINGALKVAAALALRITDFNSSDSFNTSILKQAIDKLSNIHVLDFITETKLMEINQIEAELIKLKEEGEKVSTFNILDSAIIDHFLILQSDIDAHKEEVLIVSKINTELKASYLIKQIKLTIESIIHKIGSSATMIDDTNNEVTDIGQILTETFEVSTFTEHLLIKLNAALTICNSILNNTVVGQKINGIDDILSLAIDVEIEIKLLEITARETRDTISLYTDLASRTNLVSKIVEKTKMVNGTIEPSIEQTEIINGMIDHLKTIMLVPGGGNIIDLQLKYNELFMDSDTAITGLEILSHKASSIILLLKEMFFANLDTRNAVIQMWKLEEARSLLNQSLSIIENHETETNILVTVNDIRIKNLLFEIKNIQYEEITAEQLVKIIHLNLDLKNVDSLSGLQDVRFQISEIMEFIDKSLFEFEEDKKEKQRLSSHSLVLNFLNEAYQYLHELSQNTFNLPEKSSNEVENLMIQIKNNYRNAHAIKYSYLQDLHEALGNFKIFSEENLDKSISNIALDTEIVRDMINVLQKVLKIKDKATERYSIIKQASKLVSSITLSLENLIPTEGTVIEHDFIIIENYQLLFSTFLVDDYIFSEQTIQTLEEYKKNIEYLKIDTISLIEISKIKNAIMNADSVSEFINQKELVESTIHESFNTFSRGKNVLDITEKVLLSLKTIRKSVDVDNTLEISSIIQPLLNINDDLTVITDKSTASTLLNVLIALFKIEDMETQSEGLNQIINEVQSVKENIEFHVANLEEVYRSLDSDQIISILTPQIQSISIMFHNLFGTMVNSTKLVGENRIEFQELSNILENWNQNFLEIDFQAIVNFKEEWNKVMIFIYIHFEDMNVNFGGLLDVYIMFKKLSLKVTEMGKIRVEMNILQNEAEILEGKILVIENILTDIENTISSIDLETITNFEVDEDISKIISVIENLNFKVSVEELNEMKKNIFSLGIPTNVAGIVQLKNIVFQTLTKFKEEIAWKGKTKASQITYEILSRGLTIIMNLEEKIKILPEITDTSSDTEIELSIKEKMSMFLRSFAVTSVTQSDIDTLNIILKDLLVFIGTLDLNVKVTSINDVLTSLQNIKTNIKTTHLETKSFLDKVIMMRSLSTFTTTIHELDIIIQNIVNGKVLSGDLDSTLAISTITSIIDEVIDSDRINDKQITSFVSMVFDLRMITITDDVIESLKNVSLLIPSMNKIIQEKIIGLKEFIDNKVKLNNMNIYENLLHGITNTITDVSKEIGFVASTAEQIVNKDITILIDFLKTISNALIDDTLLQDLQFKISFLTSLQIVKGSGIKGLTDLDILTSLKNIELEDDKKVFENSLKFDDQILIFGNGLEIVNSLLLTIEEILETNLETSGSNETIIEIESVLFALSNKIIYSESDIRSSVDIQLKLNIIKSYQHAPELYANINVYLTIIQDKMIELKNEISLKKLVLLKAQELFRSKRFLDNLLQKVLKISSIKPLMIMESTENTFVNKLVSKLTIWSSNVFAITSESIGILNGELYILDILTKGENMIKNILPLKELILSVHNSISLEISIIIKQIDYSQEIFIKTQIQEQLELLFLSLIDLILEPPTLMIGEPVPYITIIGTIHNIFTSTDNKETLRLFSDHFNSIYLLISDKNHDLDAKNDALKLVDELMNVLQTDITISKFHLHTLTLAFTQKKIAVLLQENLEIFKSLKKKFRTGLTIYSETNIFRTVHDFILNLDIYVATDDIILKLSNFILELNPMIDTIPAGSIINGLEFILKSIVTKSLVIQSEIDKSLERHILSSDLSILREIAIVLNRIVDDCVNDPLDPLYLDLDKTDFHPVLNEFYILTESIIKYDIKTLMLLLDFERTLKLVLIEKNDITGLHNFKIDVKKQLSFIEKLIAMRTKDIDKNLVALVAMEVLKTVERITKLLPIPVEGINRLLPVHSNRLENRNLGNNSEETEIKNIISDINIETITSEAIVKLNKFLKQINITTVNGTQILNSDLSLFAEPLYLLRKNLKDTIVFENKFKIVELKTKTLESTKKSNEAASKILLTINEDKKITSCLTNELTNFKSNLKKVSQTSAIINEKINQISKTTSQNSKSLTMTFKFMEISSAFSKFRSFIQVDSKNDSAAVIPETRHLHISSSRKKERFLGLFEKIALPAIDIVKKVAGAAHDVAKGVANGFTDIVSDIDEFILEPVAETLFGNKGVISSIISLFDDAISRIEESNIFQLGILATRDFVNVIQDAANLLFDLKNKIADLEGLNITVNTFAIIKDIERIGNLWSKGISFVTLEDVEKCQSYMSDLQNDQQGDIVFDFSILFNLVDNITTLVTNGLITQSLFTHTFEISELFQANSLKKAFGDALKEIIQRSQKFDLANQCVGLLDTSLIMFSNLEGIIDGNTDENNDDDNEAVNLINNVYEHLRTISIDIDNLHVRDIIDFGKLLGKLEPFTNVTNTGVLHFDPIRFIDIKNFLRKIQLSVNETTQNIKDFIETSQEVLIQKRASTEIEKVTSTFKNWINIIDNKKNYIVTKIDDTNQEIFNGITNFITKWGLNSRQISESDIFEFENLFKSIKFLKLIPGQAIKGFNILKVYLLDAPVSLLHLIQSGGPLSSNTYLASDKLNLLKFTEAKQALDNLLGQALNLSLSLTVGTGIDTKYNGNLNTLIGSALSTTEKWAAGLIEHFHIKGFKKMEKELNFLSLNLEDISSDIKISLQSLIGSLEDSKTKIDTFIENIIIQVAETELDVNLDDAFNALSHIKYFVDDLVFTTDANSAQAITIPNFDNVVNTLKDLSTDYLNINIETIDFNLLKDAWKGSIEEIININIEPGFKIENLVEIKKLIHSYLFSLENDIIKNKFNKIKSIAENFSFKTLCHLLNNCSKDNILSIDRDVTDIFKYLSHLEKDIYDIGIDQIRMLSSMSGIFSFSVSKFGENILYLDDITKMLANVRIQLHKYKFAQNLHFEWKRDSEILVDAKHEIGQLVTSLSDLQFNIGAVNLENIIEENENITNIFSQLLNFTSDSFSKPLFLKDILKDFDFKLTAFTPEVGIMHLNEVIQLLSHLKRKEEISESLVIEFDVMDSILKAKAVTSKLLETLIDFKIAFKDAKTEVNADIEAEILPNLLLIINPLADIQEKITKKYLDELRLGAEAYFALTIDRASEIKDIMQLIFILSHVSTHLNTMSSSLEISIQSKFEHDKLNDVLESKILLHSFIGKQGSSEVTMIISELEELLDSWIHQIRYETVDRFRYLVYQLGSAISAGGDILIDSERITTHLPKLKEHIFTKLHTTSLIIANSKKVKELREANSVNSLIDAHENFGLLYQNDKNIEIVENHLKKLLDSLKNLTEYETLNGGLSFENSSTLLEINDLLILFKKVEITFTFGVEEHLVDILKSISEDIADTPINSMILSSLINGVTDVINLHNNTRELLVNAGYTKAVTTVLVYENTGLVINEFKNKLDSIRKMINEEGQFNTNISSSNKDIEVYKQISANIIEIAFGFNLIHENTILDLNLNLQKLYNYKFVIGEKIDGISLWKHFLFDSDDTLTNIIEKFYYKPSFKLAKIHQTIRKFSYASTILNRCLSVIEKIDNITEFIDINGDLNEPLFDFDVPQRIFGLFEMSLETLQNWKMLLNMKPFELDIIESSFISIEKLIQTLKVNPFSEDNAITAAFATVKNNIINTITNHLSKIEDAVKQLSVLSEEKKTEAHIFEKLSNLKQLKNIALFMKEKLDCEINSTDIEDICNLTINAGNITNLLDEQDFLEKYEDKHNMILTFAKSIEFLIDDIESSCREPENVPLERIGSDSRKRIGENDCITDLMTFLDSISEKSVNIIKSLEKMLIDFEFSFEISVYLNLEDLD